MGLLLRDALNVCKFHNCYQSIGFRHLSQPMVWVVWGYWRPFIGLCQKKGGVFQVTEVAISRIFWDFNKSRDVGAKRNCFTSVGLEKNNSLSSIQIEIGNHMFYFEVKFHFFVCHKKPNELIIWNLWENVLELNQIELN